MPFDDSGRVLAAGDGMDEDLEGCPVVGVDRAQQRKVHAGLLQPTRFTDSETISRDDAGNELRASYSARLDCFFRGMHRLFSIIPTLFSDILHTKDAALQDFHPGGILFEDAGHWLVD